jgi:ABC-type uncharacterized transport system permease subunit
MLKYLALTRLAIQRQFIYRAATLAGLATNFFFGLLRAAVMVALFGARPQVAGMSIRDEHPGRHHLHRHRPGLHRLLEPV